MGSVLLAGQLVVQSPKDPDVVVNINTEGLCVWVPEAARDCPPELLRRFAPLATEIEAETVGAPLFVAFVREPSDGGELALAVSTRASEPHVEGDDLRFGSAQVELLCKSPQSCEYNTSEFGGVETVEIMESMPNRAFAVHTVFRGEQATVDNMLRAWPDGGSGFRSVDEPYRLMAELNAAISVRPAPLEPDRQPTRGAWLPVILRIIVGVSAAAISIGVLIARIRARRGA